MNPQKGKIKQKWEKLEKEINDFLSKLTIGKTGSCNCKNTIISKMEK
jgi:hypothetical protein